MIELFTTEAGKTTGNAGAFNELKKYLYRVASSPIRNVRFFVCLFVRLFFFFIKVKGSTISRRCIIHLGLVSPQKGTLAKGADSDLTPQNATSDQDPHFLHKSNGHFSLKL